MTRRDVVPLLVGGAVGLLVAAVAVEVAGRWRRHAVR